MKKILALFTISSTLAFANDPCCEPCEPCCVPQPKKCIDRECYTPPFYDLQCAWGTSIEVDFLYWFARENNLPFALEFSRQLINPGLSTQTSYVPIEYKYLGTAWKPGFRVGLGWDGDYDGWDSAFNWTWYKNQKKNRALTNFQENNLRGAQIFPTVGTTALINPWMNQAFNLLSLAFSEIEAKWNLLFNQLDWEMGKKYWLGRHFTMRPYAGVRGAWIKTHFVTTSGVTFINALSQAFLLSFQDSFENDNWGVGLLGGFQPAWYFGCTNNFNFFANIEASLIYGKHLAKKKEAYQELETILTDTPVDDLVRMDLMDFSRQSVYKLQPIIDLALGFSWAENWCCDRYRTELDIGWEQHIWVRGNQRFVTNDPKRLINGGAPKFIFPGPYGSFDRITTDLILGGLFVNFRFDF